MARKPSKEIVDPRYGPHHPAMRSVLVGQSEAEEKLLRAFSSGRCHHGWLLSGPKGIGKATLAYRFARFVLSHPSSSGLENLADLHVPEDHPVFRQIAARGHPDLLVVEPPLDPRTGDVKATIPVEEARKPLEFFSKTAGAGGWRICIVDAADDLNGPAANALLKILEEPPQRSLFILVSHAAGRLLPTIRSRCIELSLRPLNVQEVLQVTGKDKVDEQAAMLAEGSAGRALELADSEGAKQFITFCDVFSKQAPFDRSALMQIADRLSIRGKDANFKTFTDLLASWLANAARKTALENGDGTRAAHWAGLHGEFSHSLRTANALNLDRRQLLMDAFAKIESATVAG